MTGSSAVATASDAMLIARARLADASAFSALFDRHGPAMWALAEILSTRPDPLVAATRRVAHGAVRRVRGPSVWMRGYLLQLTWRIDSGDGTGQTATPESSRLECAMPFRDHRLSDRQVTVADAFVGLAPAWQAVLWHHEVERESDEVVAAVVGVSANGVRTLVGSAREELREALLAHRWDELPPAPCQAHLRRLTAARPGHPPRPVLRHATVCRDCATLLTDLEAVEHGLPGVLARHLLGEVGDAYVERRRVGGRA